MPPPGWASDPTGRHRYRWSDGEGWSAEVSDGTDIVTDRQAVLGGPRRRIGPCLLALLPGAVLLLMITLAIKG